ncbi:tRNA (adenosine(37)-N6)-threonylcarbamoyltransferase complex ATPase subunit type 1 TsaE [Tritonibacter horizontis]|uniref:tRNA threonylcarbamoyladenosine biosynthesis protein TsaE n=1 Tax=Tritonibacter horizontis TaxID=1768241 RepID=A0A132C2Q5_9RHOB|nr:tRNA (adenosine(37)-N6)-threonylcarbamoyltransferase complex ATPase subunit type 1 TsaE [Tritonibacter horizontis]KUP94796.1 tRNA threonylcarbamoyladenosine biosynthesis protein TsaE [Tritonibacter horizontis]
MTHHDPQRLATFTLDNGDATTILAQNIARTLSPGDVLLLEGPIGAGKTHFARSLIQSLLLAPEDVPSPTFTIVQIYDVAVGELWHADLYRLSHVDEIEELGLLAAFEEAICLVEWPDRLEELRPDTALNVRFSLVSDRDDARRVEVFWTSETWDQKLEGLRS